MNTKPPYRQPANTSTFEVYLSLDGNMWCALVGDDIQSGWCGFGPSKRDAIANLGIDMFPTDHD